MQTVANTRTYTYEHVTFILTTKKIAVDTGLQFFVIEAAEPYYVKRLRAVALLIEMGKIRSIADMTVYSGDRLLWRSIPRRWFVA
jgi:hypothetical protein